MRTIKQEIRIIELSRDKTIRQIAEELDLSRATVQAVQRKYHLTLRFGRSVSSAAVRYAYDESKWALILTELYYKQMLTVDEVAERCGIAISTVERRMRHLGLPRRTLTEARTGRKRGSYDLSNWPVCAVPLCGTRVFKENSAMCSACQKSRTRRLALGWHETNITPTTEV
jgi:predicted transcriptional regulator